MSLALNLISVIFMKTFFLVSLHKLTSLTLAHNKLTSNFYHFALDFYNIFLNLAVPAQIAELVNLKQLNLSNNQIEVSIFLCGNFFSENIFLFKELPTSISSLPKLKILKLWYCSFFKFQYVLPFFI